MIGLILSDLKSTFTPWIGLLLIAVAAGCIGEFAALLLLNAPRMSNESTSYMLSNAASIVIVFNVVAAIPSIFLTSGLFVSGKKKTYALWLLGNLSARRIKVFVLIQISLIAIVGALAGVLIMGAIFECIFPIVFSSRIISLDATLAISVGDAPAVCIAILALFLVGSSGRVNEVSRVSPIEVLRGDQRSGRSRLCQFFASVSVALALFVMPCVMATSNFEASSMIALLIPIVATLLLGVSSSLILPSVLQLWTMPIKNSSCTVLLLARSRALCSVSRSISTEAPIMILVSLASGMYSALAVLERFVGTIGVDYGSGFNIDPTLSFLIFGGPGLLGVISATVAMLVSSRSQENESSRLMLLGMSRARIVVCVICEALMHAVTALFSGLIGSLISVALICAGMNASAFFTLCVSPALLVAATGFIVIAVPMLMPAFLSFRPPFLGRID